MSKRRRGNSEGSIYQGKDGRWRGEVSLGHKADGKHRGAKFCMVALEQRCRKTKEVCCEISNSAMS